LPNTNIPKIKYKVITYNNKVTVRGYVHGQNLYSMTKLNELYLSNILN